MHQHHLHHSLPLLAQSECAPTTFHHSWPLLAQLKSCNGGGRQRWGVLFFNSEGPPLRSITCLFVVEASAGHGDCMVKNGLSMILQEGPTHSLGYPGVLIKLEFELLGISGKSKLVDLD